MNPVEKQRLVIDQLYHLMVESAETGFDTATCRFEYYAEEDGSRAVDTAFEYELNGSKHSKHLNYRQAREERPIGLVPKLHQLMKEHTGGDWQAFTLSIEENGQVKTKFEYSDENPSV
ncbi:hypothetical protein [Aliiroseovarius crassostreae]|uniref:hypothetical protein n=1 Tax=Aliiroseovarius crassostreae TaxID=154981 RepID=UPI003C7A6B7F